MGTSINCDMYTFQDYFKIILSLQDFCFDCKSEFVKLVIYARVTFVFFCNFLFLHPYIDFFFEFLSHLHSSIYFPCEFLFLYSNIDFSWNLCFLIPVFLLLLLVCLHSFQRIYLPLFQHFFLLRICVSTFWHLLLMRIPLSALQYTFLRVCLLYFVINFPREFLFSYANTYLRCSLFSSFLCIWLDLRLNSPMLSTLYRITRWVG